MIFFDGRYLFILISFSAIIKLLMRVKEEDVVRAKDYADSVERAHDAVQILLDIRAGLISLGFGTDEPISGSSVVNFASGVFGRVEEFLAQVERHTGASGEPPWVSVGTALPGRFTYVDVIMEDGLRSECYMDINGHWITSRLDQDFSNQPVVKWRHKRAK